MTGYPICPAQAKFQVEKDDHWGKFTGITRFARRIKHRFAYRVATDGESVSVLFENNSAPATAADRAEAAAVCRTLPLAEASSDKAWVQGPPRPTVTPGQRVVGIDPGSKAVFTAVVHTPGAQQTLQAAKPVR